MRKATGRLEITMHLAECSWICLIFICDCESKNGHYYFSVLPLLPFVFHLQFISSLKKFYVNVCPIHSKTLTICFLFCVGCESFNWLLELFVRTTALFLRSAGTFALLHFSSFKGCCNPFTSQRDHSKAWETVFSSLTIRAFFPVERKNVSVCFRFHSHIFHFVVPPNPS